MNDGEILCYEAKLYFLFWGLLFEGEGKKKSSFSIGEITFT
jgi:hypothetical protein